MNKALLIVDPQYDFIDGSLPVPGAAAAMDALAEYIIEHNDDYCLKIVTADWHPHDHSSFVQHSGPWPMHCVQHTHGAAVWQPVLDTLYATPGDTVVLTKGDDRDKEEYSVLQNAASRTALTRLLEAYDIEHVDICGIAGDVCVLNTLNDGIKAYGSDFFTVLQQFAPSLDGGAALSEAVAKMQ